MSATQALLLVDLQNDFFPPQGALAVPYGDQIIPVVNEYINKFQGKGLPIFASTIPNQRLYNVLTLWLAAVAVAGMSFPVFGLLQDALSRILVLALSFRSSRN